MRWEGQQESANLEDRRRLGPRGVVIGGLGTVILLLIGYFMGVDPETLKQFVGNPTSDCPAGPVSSMCLGR